MQKKFYEPQFQKKVNEATTKYVGGVLDPWIRGFLAKIDTRLKRKFGEGMIFKP